MFMLCYKNGGLAREKIRDTLPNPGEGHNAWDNFNKHCLETSALDMQSESDRAKLGLYFLLPEIVPNIKAGTWRYTCNADGTDLKKSEAWSTEKDARVVVESQALSLRLRSQRLVDSPKKGMPAQPNRVYLVGGGSVNQAIAKTVGAVLGGGDGVYKLDVQGNACALGGAYKALWSMERKEGETFDDLIGSRWHEEGPFKNSTRDTSQEPLRDTARSSVHSTRWRKTSERNKVTPMKAVIRALYLSDVLAHEAFMEVGSQQVLQND